MSSLLGAAILLIVKLLYEGESADGRGCVETLDSAEVLV